MNVSRAATVYERGFKKNYVDLALKHRDFTYGVGAGNVHRAWDTLRGKQVKLG